MSERMKQTTVSRRFSIATSWDSALLEGLSDLNARFNVSFEDVFGAFQQSLVGNARLAYRLPSVTTEQVADHIADAATRGMTYVHLLNAPELSGKMADPAWCNQLVSMLDDLQALGVTTLTIANEELLRFVKERYASTFRVKLSLIAGVDSVERAKYFEDLGVDVIALNPFSLNRDFDGLKAIRSAVRCELEIYANVPCLHQCPVWESHYRFLGRTSTLGKKVVATPDPYLGFCSERFLDDPVQLLRSPFVRPEDAQVYFDLGIDRIKLSDRAERTPFLLRTATAYAAQKHEGNLFDLVFRSGSKFRAALGPAHPQSTQPLTVTIDNDALTAMGFLAQVQKLEGAALDRFYATAAREVVRIDDGSRTTWLEAFRAKAVPLPSEKSNTSKREML